MFLTNQCDTQSQDQIFSSELDYYYNISQFKKQSLKQQQIKVKQQIQEIRKTSRIRASCSSRFNSAKIRCFPLVSADATNDRVCSKFCDSMYEILYVHRETTEKKSY